MENLNTLEMVSHRLSVVKSFEKNLVGLDRRYYNLMPEVCWQTEETLAKRLRLSRKQVRTIKNRLVNRGLVELIESTYKSGRIKHLQTKQALILTRLEGEFYERFEQSDDDFSEFEGYMNIKWDLLQSFTADELNKMKKADLVKLYQDCNFLVIPSVYPIITRNGVVCSCYRGKSCNSPGKHPVQAYKYIDSERYEGLKERYLDQFVKNPNLNIGMKVSTFSVLDVDGDKGRESLNNLINELRWEGEEDTLSEAITASTANGMHLFVNNTNLKNNASVIAEGLDIRSQGGFLVMAGSTHKTGKKYEWKSIGDVGTIPEEWLVDRPKTSRTGTKNPSASIMLKNISLPKELTPEYVIPKGQRNMTLFKWAARIRGKGGDKAHIIEELMFIRDTFCDHVDGDEVSDAQLISMAEYCVNNYLPN
jgi:predicted transcriptional regulator